MKRFYSCIDGGLPVPQPIQHLAIHDKAAKAQGAVTFYGAEEVRVLRTQPFIKTKLEKLKQKEEVDGVVFYTIHQFRYGDTLNFDLMRRILDMGLEIHFARERLSLLVPSEFEAVLPFLMSVDFTHRRDASLEWKNLVASTDLSSIHVAV
jgi:hypothetical protein